MQKLIKYLSSMKLAAILLISLILVLVSGSFLTESDKIYHAVKEMNDSIILEWLRNISQHNAIVVIWFFLLCVFAVSLGINLVFCTWENLLRPVLKRKGLKTILLFSIHFVFIIIMLLHAVSLFIGYKHGNIVLTEGDEYVFEENNKIMLDKIDFVDDPKILKKKKNSSRLDMTSDKYHYKENSAKISYYEDGNKTQGFDLRIFSPAFYNGIQFTVEKFIIDKKTGKLAVKIAITKNPFVLYFFVFYGLGILLMLLYAIVRWRY